MDDHTSTPTCRIAIIGAGQVGGAVAYALILRSLASQIILIDVDMVKRDGQVADLADVACSCHSATAVVSGHYRDARDCDIVIITAGSRQDVGQTNIEHISRNMLIVRTAIVATKPFTPETILLVVSTPNDLLTSLACQLSGLPQCQVIGSGTLLDSIRLRGLIAGQLKISEKSVDVSVIGQQGEGQIVAWSKASIGGVPVADVMPAAAWLDRPKLEEQCKARTQRILQAKGSTPFGISSVVASLCSSIVLDKRKIRSVSHFQPDLGCCLSSPAVIGRKGIVESINTALEEEEMTKLHDSAKALVHMMNSLQQD